MENLYGPNTLTNFTKLKITIGTGKTFRVLSMLYAWLYGVLLLNNLFSLFPLQKTVHRVIFNFKKIFRLDPDPDPPKINVVPQPWIYVWRKLWEEEPVPDYPQGR